MQSQKLSLIIIQTNNNAILECCKAHYHLKVLKAKETFQSQAIIEKWSFVCESS